MANNTVLIIDYEPRSIRASTVPLEKHGFVVEVAHDGIAGLKAFEKLSPALVLIEAMLPKKHGFEVCQEIKKSAQGKGTPVVITTGVYRGRKYRSQALHIYGCDEYLEKPFTEEQLLATCRRFLGETMPEPSISEHEPVASPTAGPASPEKKEAAVERPIERSQWATGTDGNARTRVSGFLPIVGDVTEAEITARLDAILPAEIPTHPVEKASTAAIAVEPTPAAPGIGVAEEMVSSDAVDLGVFDSSETPHPFERVAEPAADDLQDVTAEELAGILEPLEPHIEPRSEEAHDVEAPTRDLRIVQFDSHRDKRRRRKKRSKKQRREPPRDSRKQAPVSTACPAPTFAAPAGEMEAHEPERSAAAPGAPPREDEAPGPTVAREAAAAPSVDSATLPKPLRVTDGEGSFPPATGETEAKKSSLWMGIAAVVVIGLGATLFFMFRGEGSPRKTIATRTERAAGLGAPSTVTQDDGRDPGGLAQDRGERTPGPTAVEDSRAKARETAPAAASVSARPLSVDPAPRSVTPPQASVPRAEPPAEKPARKGPVATVEDRTTTGTAGERSATESLAARAEALPAAEPSPAPEAPLEAAPADTGALASDEPEEAEPEAPREEPAMTAQGDLVNLHEADVAPTIIRHAPPEYPVAARRLRQEGTVVLNVLVNEHGNVAEVEVIRGVTDELDAAAASAAMSWAYRPAEKDGVAVRVWKPEKVTFKL